MAVIDKKGYVLVGRSGVKHRKIMMVKYVTPNPKDKRIHTSLKLPIISLPGDFAGKKFYIILEEVRSDGTNV